MPGDDMKLAELQAADRSSQNFGRLLQLLWDRSSEWWESFRNWDEFLAWANDQYGTMDGFNDPDYGMDALDAALEAYYRLTSATRDR